MRILIDTNILFSALLFPRSKPAKALLYIAQNHEMVLGNITELRDILKRKAPRYLPDVVSYGVNVTVNKGVQTFKERTFMPHQYPSFNIFLF